MKRPERSVVVLLSCLFCLSAPAWAGIVYTISPVTASLQLGDNNDVFDVLATYTGLGDVTMESFAFEDPLGAFELGLERAKPTGN